MKKKTISLKRWIVILLLVLPIIIVIIPLYQRTLYPYITSGEFPFRFVYELDGQIFTIEDTIVIDFIGRRRGRPELIVTNILPGYRVWFFRLLEEGGNPSHIGSFTLLEFRDAESHIRDGVVNRHSRVNLLLGTAPYYMGDTWGNVHGPRIEYRESYHDSGCIVSRTSTLSHEMLEQLFGIRIIEMTFSEPIANRFTRSRN